MNMLNGHDVEYIVDEANRVVVARISNCADDAQNFLFNRCRLSIYSDRVSPRLRESLRMEVGYRAVAKCAPEDAFDAEIGRRLAFARLEKKYWECFARRLERMQTWLTQISADLAQRRSKAQTRAGQINPLDCIPTQGETGGAETTEVEATQVPD